MSSKKDPIRVIEESLKIRVKKREPTAKDDGYDYAIPRKELMEITGMSSNAIGASRKKECKIDVFVLFGRIREAWGEILKNSVNISGSGEKIKNTMRSTFDELEENKEYIVTIREVI